MMAKISVILPVYNGERYLEKSIESILAQTYTDFELIIVDDGSTDHSGIVCDGFGDRDGRIKVIHKKNEGLICARITGLEVASCEYIAFIDADDWAEERFLEALLAPMLDAKADIVASACIGETGSSSRRQENLIPAGVYEGNALVEEIYPRMLWYGGFYQFGILPYMWNKIFRREILKRCYRGIDTRIYDGEDVAAVYPYLLYTGKMVVIEEALYHYRMHENSMTSKKGPRFYENVSRLYLHLHKRFCNSAYYDCMLPQLNQYMRRMVWLGTPEQERDQEPYYFPYRKVERGATIILYGAGRVGIRYYQQMRDTKYCEVASWVDKNYRKFEGEGMPIEDPAKIPGKNYDYIVIASAKAGIREEIKNYLVKLGVCERQIITGDAEG